MGILTYSDNTVDMKKNAPRFGFAVAATILGLALFRLGILNPFRIYRHVSLVTGHSKIGQIEYLESHLSDVDEVIVFPLNIRKIVVLKSPEKERVLSVMRRVGSFHQPVGWTMHREWISFSMHGSKSNAGIDMRGLSDGDRQAVKEALGGTVSPDFGKYKETPKVVTR